MTASKSSPDWAAARQAAGRALELAQALLEAVTELDDAAGSGVGTRLERRVELVAASLQRAVEVAERAHRIAWEAEQRAAELERLQAEREAARRAIYGRR